MRSPGGSTMLDDAEGNRFLLWRNHFGHVIFPRVRTLTGERAFVLRSNTIRFSFGGNKFPANLEAFKGSNHRNHPLSGFRKSFSIYSNISCFLATGFLRKGGRMEKGKNITAVNDAIGQHLQRQQKQEAYDREALAIMYKGLDVSLHLASAYPIAHQ